MIARLLAEKDTLRCQLVELQERVFSLQAKRSPREQRQSCDVISHTSTYQHTHEHNTYRNINVNKVLCVFVKGVKGVGLGELDIKL